MLGWQTGLLLVLRLCHTSLESFNFDHRLVDHPPPPLSALWRLLGPVDSPHPLTLRFSLYQSGLGAMRQLALNASDPRSSAYGAGKHASQAELDELAAPLRAAVMEDQLAQRSRCSFH